MKALGPEGLHSAEPASVPHGAVCLIVMLGGKRGKSLGQQERVCESLEHHPRLCFEALAFIFLLHYVVMCVTLRQGIFLATGPPGKPCCFHF